MPEFQEYLENVLINCNRRDHEQVKLGLSELDELLTKLCVLKYDELTYEPSAVRKTGNSSSIVERQATLSESGLANSLESHYQRRWKLPKVGDVVFGEFLTLQDKVQYNVVSQLIQIIPFVSTFKENESLRVLFRILQGCFLLHPPSRNLITYESKMWVLLEFLSPRYSPQVIEALIPVLVSSLVRNVPNIRIFERLGGPQYLCELLTHKSDVASLAREWKEVQVKVLEFLFFYLIPESQSLEPKSSFRRPVASKNEKLSNVKNHEDGHRRKGTNEKATILNRYLNGEITKGLVTELQTSKPFGEMNIEW
ncbi:hypothetical protein KL918_002976 [Ogataea parapolymorpha]|uniref:Cell division control protein 14 n=1 Tax=Ogataea parapolymorpha (strain ATCC 26012 / BCRC 20466 / JCM 22074 / NRRL Y-7560 / DL-1) TaxID=871575 RepID=W1QD37_OGAPD|nr:hypothetical protein HPODL_01697 [Ogataea parapolymorpha DL-1]ESW97602.1 hypothetical protein HPODL_01697 [Ogataea parapolymorpha DL-1]KAG7866781.1 hypothetical protein KL918_002976 [Ogataea parapolymorpha]KAG7871932.1 hypothetical protein KL916_003535 [Ogataea parapolymorpha]